MRYFDEECLSDLLTSKIWMPSLLHIPSMNFRQKILVQRNALVWDLTVDYGDYIQKNGDVQAILCKKYTKALVFHFSSHKLNLVIYDLNTLPENQNIVRTSQDIITFFRESVF